MKIVDLANHRGSDKAVTPLRQPGRYFLTSNDTLRHGVVVGRAIQCGILTLDDFSAILANCNTCGRHGPDGRNQDLSSLCDKTPEWCANRAVLEGIRGLV